MTIEEFIILCKNLNWYKLREVLLTKTFKELPSKILISALIEVYRPEWRPIYGLNAFWNDRLYNIPTNELMIRELMAVNLRDFYKAFHLTKIFYGSSIDPTQLQSVLIYYVQTHKYRLAEILILYPNLFTTEEIQDIEKFFGNLTFSLIHKQQFQWEFCMYVVHAKQKFQEKIGELEKLQIELGSKIDRFFDLSAKSSQVRLHGLEKMKVALNDDREYLEMDQALSLPIGQSILIKMKYFSFTSIAIRFNREISAEEVNIYAQKLRTLGIKARFSQISSFIASSIYSIELSSSLEAAIDVMDKALIIKRSISLFGETVEDSRGMGI